MPSALSDEPSPRIRLLCAQPLILEVPTLLGPPECASLLALALARQGAAHCGKETTGAKRVISLAAEAAEAAVAEAANLEATADRAATDLDTWGSRRMLRRVCSFAESLLGLPGSSYARDSPVVHFTPIPCAGADEASGSGHRLGLGLHLDTNHRPMRCATAILYLTTLAPECGGSTVFPCARNIGASGELELAAVHTAARSLVAHGGRLRTAPPALLDDVNALPSQGERRLAGEMAQKDFEVQLQIQHTDQAFRENMDATAEEAAALGEYAKILLRAAEESRGLAAAPVAGKLVVFFSRGPDGCVDPLSFHGGADVRRGDSVAADGLQDGKWTMQIFCETPLEIPPAAATGRRARALRAAASGSGPLVWAAEAAARRGAVRARASALARLGLKEADLVIGSCAGRSGADES